MQLNFNICVTIASGKIYLVQFIITISFLVYMKVKKISYVQYAEYIQIDLNINLKIRRKEHLSC